MWIRAAIRSSGAGPMRPCIGSKNRRSMRRRSIRSGTIPMVVSGSTAGLRLSTCRASPSPASMPAASPVAAAISMAWEGASSMVTLRAQMPRRNPALHSRYMASKTEKTHGQTTCIVHVSPDIVDAGAEMTLRGEVSCSPACDLRGHTLLVKDELGAEACCLELNEFDGVANGTREFVLKAPVKPGQYAWLALSPAVVKQGVSYAQASTPISITVKPHSMHVV